MELATTATTTSSTEEEVLQTFIIPSQLLDVRAWALTSHSMEVKVVVVLLVLLQKNDSNNKILSMKLVLQQPHAVSALVRLNHRHHHDHHVHLWKIEMLQH